MWLLREADKDVATVNGDEQVVAVRMKHVLEVFNDLVISQLCQGHV